MVAVGSVHAGYLLRHCSVVCVRRHCGTFCCGYIICTKSELVVTV